MVVVHGVLLRPVDAEHGADVLREGDWCMGPQRELRIHGWRGFIARNGAVEEGWLA